MTQKLIDLLIDFDELGFVPMIPVLDPDKYASEWKEKLIQEIKVYKNNIINKMFENIKNGCLEKGIYPACVSSVMKSVSEKMINSEEIL